MQTINDISADIFIKQCRTGTPSVPMSNLITNIIPSWRELVTMVETKEVFNSIENTQYFFRKLKTVYKNILSELVFKMTNRYIQKTDICTVKLLDLFSGLIQDRVYLEPYTKLFLEDLYSVMYIVNSNKILSQHFALASLPIVNYRIGNRGLVLNTNLEQEKVDCDISRLLNKCGEKGTLEVIQLLLCILVNYEFYNSKHELDLYLPKHSAYTYGSL